MQVVINCTSKLSLIVLASCLGPRGSWLLVGTVEVEATSRPVQRHSIIMHVTGYRPPETASINHLGVIQTCNKHLMHNIYIILYNIYFI